MSSITSKTKIVFFADSCINVSADCGNSFLHVFNAKALPALADFVIDVQYVFSHIIPYYKLNIAVK